MKLAIIIYLISSILNLDKQNPGAVMRLPKASIILEWNKLLPDINRLISHLEINERFDSNWISIKGFDMDFTEISPNQVTFDFATNPEMILMAVTGLKFKFKAPIDLHAVFIQTQGWIYAEGIVSGVYFGFKGVDFTEKHKEKPYVAFTFTRFDMNPDDLKI